MADDDEDEEQHRPFASSTAVGAAVSITGGGFTIIGARSYQSQPFG